MNDNEDIFDKVNAEGKQMPTGFEFQFIQMIPVVQNGMVTLVPNTSQPGVEE